MKYKIGNFNELLFRSRLWKAGPSILLGQTWALNDSITIGPFSLHRPLSFYLLIAGSCKNGRRSILLRFPFRPPQLLNSSCLHSPLFNCTCMHYAILNVSKFFYALQVYYKFSNWCKTEPRPAVPDITATEPGIWGLHGVYVIWGCIWYMVCALCVVGERLQAAPGLKCDNLCPILCADTQCYTVLESKGYKLDKFYKIR